RRTSARSNDCLVPARKGSDAQARITRDIDLIQSRRKIRHRCYGKRKTLMKLLFSRFGISRTLGSAILSVAMLCAIFALATSTKYATTQTGSATAASVAPACTATATYSAAFVSGQPASADAVQNWTSF